MPSTIVIGGDGCSATNCSVPNIDDVFASNVPTGSPSAGTYVGTLSTAVSGTPPFSGSYGFASSGGSCTGGSDTTHFSIAGDQLQTNGAVAGTTYHLCVSATAGGTTIYQPFTVAVGHIINAQLSYCGSNGGGNGTSGSPWKGACIQAAINAAVAGDTVFLAAGYWQLASSSAPVLPTNMAGFTLLGAGSGNTFSAAGNPNNASGTTACGQAGVTCVYTSGTTGSGGYLALSGGGSGCGNDTFAHILFDGSQGYTGGDNQGTFNINACNGPFTFSDIRVMGPATSGQPGCPTATYPTGCTETQFRIDTVGSSYYGNPCPTNVIGYPMCVLIKNSVFALPSAGGYGSGQTLENVTNYGETDVNNVFWQLGYNPTDNEYNYISGNWTSMAQNVNFPSPNSPIGSGCHLGTKDFPGYECAPNGLMAGLNHITYTNNYHDGGSLPFSVGGSVNDPSTNGDINDVTMSGNWLFADTAAYDVCIWYIFADQGNCSDNGMAFNVAVNTGDVAGGCSALSRSDTNSFTWQNNTAIATTAAELNAVPQGTMLCFDGNNPSPGGVAVSIQVRGLSITKNYLKSPSNQYNTNSNNISAVVSGNYCDQSGAGTVPGCATGGFTSNPTATFTLGNPYEYNGTYYEPFVTTGFTAQYGAVEWLASTAPTVPTSSGQTGTGCNGSACSWAYIPPAWLAGVTHGSTVYLWTMDSLQHISAGASAVVP